MRRRLGRPDTYSLTILATSLRKAINNRNTKLMVETKTSPYMHDIELHFTKKKKGHKQEIKGGNPKHQDYEYFGFYC